MAGSRKQRRLLEKVRRLTSLRSTYEDYCKLMLDGIDRKAAEKIESGTAAIRRKLAEDNFAFVETEKIAEAVTEARVRSENERFSKLLSDAAAAGINLSDSEFAKLTAIYEKKLETIKSHAAEQAAALRREGIGSEACKKSEDDARKLCDRIRENCLHDAERKKESARSKYAKRINRLTARIESTEADIRRLDAPDDSMSLGDGISLHVDGLKMYFGGVKAVDDLSFDVHEGEIFGLIGPNGAGKTTVFNCITQFYKPTAGTLLFKAAEGKTIDLTRERVHDVILHGIVRTFQNVEVVPEISVLENLMVAGHRQFTSGLAASALHLPKMKMENQVVRERARKVLDFMGLTGYADFYAFGLPYGILKKIEIARTLMCSPRLIILDEPAAGLNDTETAELAQLIRRIRDEYNCTILLVEHDMGLVMDVCDNICAIAFGKLLAYGTPAEIQSNCDVQQAYLGVDEEAE